MSSTSCNSYAQNILTDKFCKRIRVKFILYLYTNWSEVPDDCFVTLMQSRQCSYQFKFQYNVSALFDLASILNWMRISRSDLLYHRWLDGKGLWMQEICKSTSLGPPTRWLVFWRTCFRISRFGNLIKILETVKSRLWKCIEHTFTNYFNLQV